MGGLAQAAADVVGTWGVWLAGTHSVRKDHVKIFPKTSTTQYDSSARISEAEDESSDVAVMRPERRRTFITSCASVVC